VIAIQVEVKVSQTVPKNTGMLADPQNSLQIGLYKLVQVKRTDLAIYCQFSKSSASNILLIPTTIGSGKALGELTVMKSKL
jgi:hypothetical protein